MLNKKVCFTLKCCEKRAMIPRTEIPKVPPGIANMTYTAIMLLSRSTLAGIPLFFNRSRRKLFLVVVVVFIIIVLSSLGMVGFRGDLHRATMDSILNTGSTVDDDRTSGGDSTIDNDQTTSITGDFYVRDLEIYGGDLKYQQGKSSINWGDLGPGASSAVSFYVKSTNTVDVELALRVTDWTPIGIEQYMEVTWNSNGAILSPNQVKFVTVTLYVPSTEEFIQFITQNDINTFSFDTTIYASGK